MKARKFKKFQKKTGKEANFEAPLEKIVVLRKI